MSALPDNLYTRCRTTLLRCREFRSYQELRAVFVTEHLFPFRIGLLSADNPATLVDLCIDYLIEQRLKGGEPVLPMLMITLCDRYEHGDELRDELYTLYQDVHAAMVQPEAPRPSAPQINHRLFDLLPSIDFRDQVRAARQVINTHPIAGFLVHGEPECGQQLLLNRLIRLSPGWQTAQRIRIDLGSNGVGKSTRALWRQIAMRLNLTENAVPIEIREKICQWLHTQDVIFIFDSVDSMLPRLLPTWLQEFWQPLVPIALHALRLTNSRAKLVLFLIDHGGEVCGWELRLPIQSDHPAYPQMPLQLPPASRFSYDMLDDWINGDAAEIIPTGLTAQTLLDETDNGLPHLVYARICRLCGLSWEGDLARWLI